MMKETPIMFGSWAIPKILDGSKTMTRRTRGLELINSDPAYMQFQRFLNVDGNMIAQFRHVRANTPADVKCPYQVGDRLWIKETWAAQSIYDDYLPRDIPVDSVIFYKTNDRLKLEVAKEHRDLGKWRSAMFMCKWMSRIVREITEVRAERLQDIKCGGYMFKSDVQKEGCPFVNDPSKFGMDEIAWFVPLWDSLNAKRGYPWASNPWNFVISFRRLE